MNRQEKSATVTDRARGRGLATPRQRVGGVVALLFAAGLIWLAGALLLSALQGLQADRFLNSWSEAGEPPDPAAFAVAEAAAIRAIQRYPGPSGVHWERLARIYAWPHWRAPRHRGKVPEDLPAAAVILTQPLGAEGVVDPATTRLRALAAYTEATTHRPLWATAVVSQAQIRLQVGVADPAFAELLHRAFELGPWRPAINRRITEAGLRAWPRLDMATRELVLENARRTVGFSRRDERRVRALGERLGLVPILEAEVLP